ncbi:MAG: sel1 repeat family protein [Gammaproteobacteria bacterium]|nr:sel1 repeat family protein [Gammaproteobacteria bacterium]
MKRVSLLLIPLFLLMSCSTNRDGNLNNFQSKEETLFDRTYRKASSGNEKSQLNLGLMYLVGEGVNQDLLLAKNWFRKSALQGNAAAQFNTGVMYYDGNSVGNKNDIKNAIFWFSKAAYQNYPGAMNNLALAYIANNDIDSGLLWLEKSAESGSGYGAYLLADIYDKGIGVKKNSDKVKYWAKKALNSSESENPMPYKQKSKDLIEMNQSFFEKLFD